MSVIPGTLYIVTPHDDGCDVDDKGKLTAELVAEFHFQDDDPGATSYDVCHYPEIPGDGDTYSINGKEMKQFVFRGARARKVTEGRPDSIWWKVEVKYKWVGEDDEEENGFDESSTTVSCGTLVIPTVARYDYFNKPVLNSAGQLFDPPAQYDRRVAMYSVTRNEFSNPMLKCLEFSGTVNASAMWGLEAYTILVNDIKSTKSIVHTESSDRGRPLWSVTYDIAICTSTHGFDKDGKPIYGWQTAVLDCGVTGFTEESPNVPVRFRDDNGLEVDTPQRLDGNGKLLTNNAQDIYIPLMLYPLKELSLLRLPDPTTV